MTHYHPGTYRGQLAGQNGPLIVEITVTSDQITDIKIAENHDHPDYGGRAIPQLAQLMVDQNTPDVDGISGATGSSTRFKQLVNDILADARVASTDANTSASTNESPSSQSPYTAGSYLGKVSGFNGQLVVEVTVTDQDISDIKVIEAHETPDVGGKAITQLIQTMITNQSAAVDTVSGATSSSNSFIKAVNQALAQARGEAIASGDELIGDFTPGTYQGTAKGFATDIDVEIDVDTDRIQAIRLIKMDDTPNIGGQAIPIVLDRIHEQQNLEVDGVAGATYSSRGAKNAVKNAVLHARGEAPQVIRFNAGTYQGYGTGINVTMTLSDQAVDDIQYEITNPAVAAQEEAVKRMVSQIKDQNLLEFDSISGASAASQGLRQSINSIKNTAVYGNDRLSESPLKDENRITFKHGSLTLEQIEGILDAIQEELIFVGPDLRFQYFNDDAKVYSYSDADLGKLYTDCHPPRARAASRELSRQLANRERKSYSFWYTNEQGERLTVTYKAIFNKQDEFIGLLGWTFNAQPYLDIADIPAQIGDLSAKGLANPLALETQEEVDAFMMKRKEGDEMARYVANEVARLNQAEQQSKKEHGDY